jgi:hypothetical protein
MYSTPARKALSIRFARQEEHRRIKIPFSPIAQCLHEFKASNAELAHREGRRRGTDSIIGTNISNHTAPNGHRRHEQVLSRLPSRLVSSASPPEFGELLGKGSPLGVTRLSGGPAPRQIHRFHAIAEYILRVAIREDGFDPAAACA